MSDDNEQKRDFVLSPAVFYALLLAASGGPVSALVVPTLQKDTAYGHAKIAGDAVTIAAANSTAIVELRNLILDRTSDRFRKSDHANYAREQAQRDALQDRRIDHLERNHK